jgi:glutathione S-transferase
MSSSDQAPKLKLYYFNIKGKGEPIRLMCAYGGFALEDHRFASRDEFTKLKEDGSLAFGQVPLLEVTLQDGTIHKLVQSAAILRYLGILMGVYPTNDPITAAMIDAALDAENDAFTGVTVASYTTRFGIEMTDEQKTAAYDMISKETLPRHLGNLERLVQASTTGFLCNTEKPSPADFAWYSRLRDFLPEKTDLSPEVRSLTAFPALQEYVKKMEHLPELQAYYKK